jgi:hypothetical protein
LNSEFPFQILTLVKEPDDFYVVDVKSPKDRVGAVRKSSQALQKIGPRTSHPGILRDQMQYASEVYDQPVTEIRIS